MSFPRIALFLSALAFGGIGLAFLVAPARMASFVDLSLGSDLADNDVRAVYGGLPFGFGVFLLLAIGRPEWQRPALWAVVLSLGCMASARFLSWMVVGQPPSLGYALHASELAGCVIGVLALRTLREARA